MFDSTLKLSESEIEELYEQLKVDEEV